LFGVDLEGTKAEEVPDSVRQGGSPTNVLRAPANPATGGTVSYSFPKGLINGPLFFRQEFISGGLYLRGLFF
jgi:hypothetical protein